jgi:hypothetical protein
MSADDSNRVAGSRPKQNIAAYMQTGGELSSQALACFFKLQAAERGLLASSEARLAAVGLVEACLTLVEKLPEGSRRSFEAVLPLTKLEQRMLRPGALTDARAVDALAERLVEWAGRSPVLVDEASVHAADFLLRLRPHLDRWQQREDATAAARVLVHV